MAQETLVNNCARAWRWDTVTSLTLVAAGLLGLAFALLMPPFQFTDEHSHFARSYQIAAGQFAGHADPEMPPAVLASLSRYPEGFGNKPAPRTSVQDLFSWDSGESRAFAPIGEMPKLEHFNHGILATQVYWTGSYLPASVGIRIARFLNMSPVGMLYGARLMNLVFFLAALSVTFLMAPGSRALIAAVALMPMTLQQAVAVSADQMTISLALVGFALILYTREHPVGRRYLATVFILVPLWVLCKSSLWALPLLLLIPGSQFRGKSQRAAFLISVTFVTIAALLTWRAMTSDAFAQFTAEEIFRYGIDFHANARLLAAHPLDVFHDLVIFPGSRTYIPGLIHEFFGVFGWQLSPLRLGPAYMVMLVAVACLEMSPLRFTIAERIILFLAFASALIGTYAALFIIDGAHKNGHYGFWAPGGGFWIYAVQGRYFIPYCLAGLLTLRQTAFTVRSRTLAPVVLVVSTLCALVALGTINRFFYH